MSIASITYARLRELLDYSPETGLFTRRVQVAQAFKAGQVAGSVRSDGYIAIKIDGRSYFAQRLAWLWMTGEWPVDEVDHEDRNRAHNNWSNLRPATTKQNNENQTRRKDNTSGIVGVTWCPKSNKWRARIRSNGKPICLGFFSCIEGARAARIAAERLYFTHSQNSRTALQSATLAQPPHSAIATMQASVGNQGGSPGYTASP